ncbi:MAG: hypothetical protein Q8R37_03310 [Nanoarchaeota archaeon]|nr:hypothetical protein [Nanoarchaeota archaeon]
MKTICVLEQLDEYLSTRNSIKSFFIYIENLPETEICLDFTNIKFISRSSADEYLKQKKASLKIIYEKNMPNEIKHILISVSGNSENFRQTNVIPC